MVKVKLKKGHPTGSYRRAGIVFTVDSYEIFTSRSDVPQAIWDDEWLIKEEVKPKIDQKEEKQEKKVTKKKK